MGPTVVEEVPKLKEWPDFSGEGEYDNMELIGGIDIIEDQFELLERLVTERFNTLFTRSAHRWYNKTTEEFPAKDIVNILEVTNRTTIGSSRVNLKAIFNTPWNDHVEKNPQENSHDTKYKSSDGIRKCHIFQSTTHLANACPRKGTIYQIDIEKEPDSEKDDVMKE
ncbi:hypothetical protein O181_050117 [Austropuccinia psidii MF-1]|uniref:Uncharacterized protein n=1 Tax=Austropuccinia psidii MF-1 TaxID=1389203 RepID=A0A9Q3HNA1_9BASI|nr:hypothetical protein [Austropuccinia psidii MF-1]